MLHLIKLEWKKFRNYRVFKVMIGFYIVLLPLLLLLFKNIPELPRELDSFDSFFMFPTIWSYLGYIGNWLCFFFLGFIAVIIVTSEFGNRTLKQNIITGLSRKEYFMAKVSFMLSIAFFATLYYLLVGLIIGFFNTRTIYISKVLEAWDMIPRYYLMCIGYMSFGLMMGFLIRRTGIAIFLYLSYVMFIELVIRWAFHLKMFQHKSVHFYPMNAVEDLIPMPFPGQIDDFVREFKFEFFLSPVEAVITTLVYTSLFLFVCYRRVTKSDL